MLRKWNVACQRRAWQQPMRLLSSENKYVSIGDLKFPIRSPNRLDLVPRGYFDTLSGPEVLEHIRWIAQKRLMNQDIFLLGFPTNLRRRIIMAAAELCDWEVLHVPFFFLALKKK